MWSDTFRGPSEQSIDFREKHITPMHEWHLNLDLKYTSSYRPLYTSLYFIAQPVSYLVPSRPNLATHLTSMALIMKRCYLRFRSLTAGLIKLIKWPYWPYAGWFLTCTLYNVCIYYGRNRCKYKLIQDAVYGWELIR